MNPFNFPQAKTPFIAPSDMDASQVFTIKAFRGKVNAGNLDGADFVVTAWKPTEEELKQLNEGNAVFLTCLGGLPPHFLTTSFEEACRM
jgi:hypothetical protein